MSFEEEIAAIAAEADGIIIREPTDSDNADRLVQRHGADLRYVEAWRDQGWCSWDGSRWRLRDRATAQEYAKGLSDVIREEANALAAAEEQDRANRLFRWAGQSRQAARVAATLQMATSIPRLRAEPDDFDRDPFLLGVEGGTVDLRTGTLRPPLRGDLISKTTGVVFDPDARCPLFLDCLGQWQQDPEVRRYLQVLTGYSLIGRVTEHILPIFFGQGANGKGTFIKAIAAAVGEYAATADPSLLMATGRFGGGPTEERADLYGRRLVTASETREGRLDEAAAKMLTGGDKIAANRKYEHQFTFDPTWTLWLITNCRPDIGDLSEGMWRRVKLIPWDASFPEGSRDLDLDDRLAAEAPGMLAWCVAGAVEYVRSGLPTPPVIAKATGEYREDEDLVGRWVEARCYRRPDTRTLVSAAYQEFERWCEDEAVPREAVPSSKAFGWRLRAMGFEGVKSNGVRLIQGFVLRDEGDRR